MWADAQGHPNLERLQKPRQGAQSVEAAERARLARAKHFALNMQLQDARQCLTDPSLLSFAEPGIQAKMHALFGDCVDSEQAVYDYPDDIGENDDRWGFDIGKMLVKMREGPDMNVETFRLAIYDFLEELQAKLQPGSTFEVSDAMHHRPHGTPYAWIIDNLTCVSYQHEAIAVIDWILAEALKHGLHCNMPKFHVWITGRPEDNVSFVEALQARGVEYSYDGLRRLLGVPIGSPSFCAKPGGHLDSVVTKASALIDLVCRSYQAWLSTDRQSIFQACTGSRGVCWQEEGGICSSGTAALLHAGP